MVSRANGRAWSNWPRRQGLQQPTGDSTASWTKLSGRALGAAGLQIPQPTLQDISMGWPGSALFASALAGELSSSPFCQMLSAAAHSARCCHSAAAHSARCCIFSQHLHRGGRLFGASSPKRQLHSTLTSLKGQVAFHGAAGQDKAAPVVVFISTTAGSSAALGAWLEEISKVKVQPEQPAALFRATLPSSFHVTRPGSRESHGLGRGATNNLFFFVAYTFSSAGRWPSPQRVQNSDLPESDSKKKL